MSKEFIETVKDVLQTAVLTVVSIFFINVVIATLYIIADTGGLISHGNMSDEEMAGLQHSLASQETVYTGSLVLDEQIKISTSEPLWSRNTIVPWRNKEQKDKRYISLYVEAYRQLSAACDESKSIASKLKKASELAERLPVILFCLKEAKVELATYTSPQVRTKITERINEYEQEFFAGKEYLEGFDRPTVLAEFNRASRRCDAAISNVECVEARTCDF